MTGSRTNSEYKHDLIALKNLAVKLKEKDFQIEKMWAKKPPGGYDIENGAEKIKQK